MATNGVPQAGVRTARRHGKQPRTVPRSEGQPKRLGAPNSREERSDRVCSLRSEGQPKRLGALNSREERSDRVCSLREDCLSTALVHDAERF